MIILGVQTKRALWYMSFFRGSSSGAGSAFPAATTVKHTAPSPAVTLESVSSKMAAKTEPRPFILIGGLPAIFGTTVLSNPTVQDWVEDLIPWTEPTGPMGEPMVW